MTEHQPEDAPHASWGVRGLPLPASKQPPGSAPRPTGAAILGALGLCLVLGLLAAGYQSSVKRAQVLAKQSPPEEPVTPQAMEAGAFGSLSGHLVPADGGAVVHFYQRDGSAPKYAFADPNSGAFTVPELPVDVYRVVVRPENPALEARVIEDVVVPWGDRKDMGAIDLRPEGERFPIEDGDTAASGD
jgi:hypothetical protein